MLNYGRLPKKDIAPFIDETGLTQQFDFIITEQVKNFDEFKKYLQTLGLDLVKGEKEMKVVVIRDPKKEY